MNKTAIIIGDSFPNTLGLIWSLGEAKVPMILILVGNKDRICITKSRYLKKQKVYQVETIKEVLTVLEKLKNINGEKTIICTNDLAAEFIDCNESYLSHYFNTPCRGKKIASFFNKAEQCNLALLCGLDIPLYMIYKRGDKIEDINIKYPILTKPLISTEGGKSDIHICYDSKDLKNALSLSSNCTEFIIQEYIIKEFEINVQGLCTQDGQVIFGGAIRKIRHYPETTGAASYAILEETSKYHVNTEGIEQMISRIGYHGPFSVEFLHRGGKNYFMEVNLRNDGLAFTSTRAGINLPEIYISNSFDKSKTKINCIYMMWLSLEMALFKLGHMKFLPWLKQFHNTHCFIDYNQRDLLPLIYHGFNILARYFRFSSKKR